MILTRLAASLALVVVALAGCGAYVDTRADKREAAAEAAYPPEGRFVTVDGQRLHYVQQGRGPDLVLIHGASGNTRDFTFRFLDAVKDRYRVTIFDRPGLGYTDRISPGLNGAANATAASPQQQAALLQAAAARLGVTRPIVLGHSYGGAVAAAWGLEHDPAALVIVSGAVMPWPGGLGPLYEITSTRLGGAVLVPLITAFAPQSRVTDAIATIFAPQPIPDGYIAHVGPALSLRRASFRTNARQVGTLKPHVVEMSARYDTLTMPVEILHGAADEVVPADIHAERMAPMVPGATLTLLPGIGHMPHHVARDEVIAAIDRAAARAGLR